MLSFRDLLTSFRKLGLGQAPVLVHASLSAFGPVHGGAETVVGALLAAFTGVMTPTFTYKTMITPGVGPPDNGISYGYRQDANRMAEFFHPDLPADPLMGVISETLRQHPRARRSTHPIYSFAGVNVENALRAQGLENPMGPIQVLSESEGWVLLLGVDHTSNTSIHYAEKIAGRKQFVRWALTPQGILACPGWPGCSGGFEAISPRLKGVAHQTQIGQAKVQAIPLNMMVQIAARLILKDPLALLCQQLDCERCNTIRRIHKNLI